MKSDIVDNLLIQWADERPEMDADVLGIVVRIDLLAKELRKRANSALREFGLAVWEYDVLSVLRRHGEPYTLGASELAHQTQLSSGAMTNRIDRLEERRLVQRRTDPGDRRGVQVQLTESGRTLIDRAVAKRLTAAETSLAMLDDSRQRELADTLRVLLNQSASPPAA